MESKAVHNLTPANQGVHDPPLTPYGEEQCLELRSTFPYHDSISLLICSPLQRTIQTTLLGFDPEISRGVQCIALPELQEVGDLPSDTGSDVPTLKEKYKNKPIDFRLLPGDWNSKTGRWAFDRETIERRCRDARQWLRARDEEAIVVVSHGGLLHYLTEDWAGSEKVEGTGWENAEFRSYRFLDGDNESASLGETPESRQTRANKNKSFTDAEKTELTESAAKTWEAQTHKKINRDRRTGPCEKDGIRSCAA
ncbi:MAG: hypothetical protein Q9171_004137 [Xanthocarpia ochracea]